MDSPIHSVSQCQASTGNGRSKTINYTENYIGLRVFIWQSFCLKFEISNKTHKAILNPYYKFSTVFVQGLFITHHAVVRLFQLFFVRIFTMRFSSFGAMVLFGALLIAFSRSSESLGAFSGLINIFASLNII